ncbi:MAG: transposase, partial [Betaproteobacteria bacterium]|nr:transposase [Betaproteobacteria bacterium]
DPKARQLMTVRGIGPIIATAVIAKQTEPERFANARQFAAYFGTVPDQHSSGSKVRFGSVNQRRHTNIAAVALANKNARIAWALLNKGGGL